MCKYEAAAAVEIAGKGNEVKISARRGKEGCSALNAARENALPGKRGDRGCSGADTVCGISDVV